MAEDLITPDTETALLANQKSILMVGGGAVVGGAITVGALLFFGILPSAA